MLTNPDGVGIFVLQQKFRRDRHVATVARFPQLSQKAPNPPPKIISGVLAVGNARIGRPQLVAEEIHALIATVNSLPIVIPKIRAVGQAQGPSVTVVGSGSEIEGLGDRGEDRPVASIFRPFEKVAYGFEIGSAQRHRLQHPRDRATYVFCRRSPGNAVQRIENAKRFRWLTFEILLQGRFHLLRGPCNGNGTQLGR